MSNSSETNRGSTRREDPALDEAIEKCIVKLESGDAASIDSVIAEFPQHENELREFLDDWGGMEGFVAQISDSLNGDELVSTPVVVPAIEGRVFGDFELQEKIGAGGMGVIYKARQISLNRIVALKMILGERADRDRFRLEAEAIAAMAHPNIVSIYEIGEHDGRLFFSMQFIDGCNLKQYIAQNKITANEAAKITESVARAVHYAHQRGILHRDLKPANILMDVDGQPHITDFGLAKHIERDTELTTSGTIMGTPGYMAPEQASGKIKNLTVATDVYGLGAILYALLTGEAPFTGNSTLEVIRQVSEVPPRSPRIVSPDIDQDIETLCLKCLEKAPEHRYVSAEDLANDLSRFLSGLPVQARPVPGLEKAWRWCRRNPAIAGLSTLAVLLLLATTVSSFLLAISERAARINSDRNAEREKLLKNKVDAALVEERKTKSAMHLANGIWRAETGDVPGALLSFAESARSANKSPDEMDNHLRRWNSWYESHPRLVASTMLSAGYQEVEKGGWDRVEFRSLGSEVLIQAGSQFVVWNFDKDIVWNLNTTFGSVTSATWSARGDELAIGCSDGRILRLNPESQETIDEIKTDSAVTQIIYSHDCNHLAVANSGKLMIVDVLSGEKKTVFPAHPRRIVYLKFGPSGNELLSIALDRKARLFEIENPESAKIESPVYRTKPSEYMQPFRPEFIHGGRSLLLRANHDDYLLFDVATGLQIGATSIDQHMYSFAVKDEFLVMAGDKEAQVRQIASPVDEISNISSLNEEQLQQENRLLSDPVGQMLHSYRTTNCDVSESGLIATGNWDQNVRLWKLDVASEDAPSIVQKKQIALLPHQTRVRKVKFSEDSKHLITIQIDGLVRIFDLTNARPDDYVFDSPRGVNFARIVDDKYFITTGSSSWYARNANVSMRCFDSSEVQATTEKSQDENDDYLLDAICSMNNRTLITLHSRSPRSRSGFTSNDKSAGDIRFWNWPDCTELESQIFLDSEPRWIEHHPFTNQAAVCTSNMDVVLIDTETQKIENVLTRDTTKYNFDKRYSHFPQHPANQQLQYSPDGKSLVVWSQYNVGAFVWNLENAQLRFEPFENDGWPLTAAEYSSDGKYIVFSGGRNRDVTIIDALTGQQMGKVLEHTVVSYNAHFNSDSSLVVTSCRDGKARVFNWKTGDLIHNDLIHTADVLDAVFTPDSKYILSIGNDRQLKIWNANDGTIAVRPIEISRGSRHVKVSQDSRFAIVYGGHDYNSVIKLPNDDREQVANLDQAILASQLIANHKMQDNASVKINTEEWFSAWQNFKRKR